GPPLLRGLARLRGCGQPARKGRSPPQPVGVGRGAALKPGEAAWASAGLACREASGVNLGVGGGGGSPVGGFGSGSPRMYCARMGRGFSGLGGGGGGGVPSGR